ncbi:uncharacterized protein [Macrobrachium rosenbergii]|uniref:uncharacterized protein n=1 Tax=Macrobrachium rosenbergii TaxID=79674 RepID=UPI0034D6C07E
MSHSEGPEAPNNLHGAQTPGTEESDEDFPGFPNISMKLRSLKLKRVRAEIWLRCAARKLNGLLQGQPSWHELTSLVDEFDHHKSKWVELDDAVQDLIENPEEVKRLVYEADGFLSEVDQTRIAAAEVLERLGNGRLVNLNSRATEGSIISASEPSSEAHSVKLPKLELLKFGGKITEWMPFWDQFKAIVDDKPMPPVNKFMYLRSVLEGKARRVIQGLVQTAANYKSACELLEERYAKPNKIISAHIQDLMQLVLSRRSKYDNQLSALRKLQDDVIAHVRSLEALGVGGDQYGRGLNHRKTEDPGVEKRQKKLIQGSASALQTSSEDSASKQQCAFRGKLHPSDKCFGIVKLSLHKREEAIRGKRLCLKCLSPGHYARGCWARCSKCKGGHHHALICRKSEVIPPVTASEKTPEGEKVQVESETVMHVGVAPCESRAKAIKQCCVLQTAKIKVIGYQGIISATVMFDTGSDRSYISKDLVKRVRPKWLTSEYLSFSAFGGGKASKADLSSIYEVMSLGADNHKYSFKVAEINEDSLINFWDLESVGIQAQETRSDAIKPDPILVQFEKLEQYYTVFEEYEKEGIIEEIPPHQLEGGYPVFYLPHRPVVQEASLSTKIRPVFDGSARGNILGADSPAEACARFDEACGMLKKAGMSLSKCTSNYKTLPMTEDSIVEGVKVLGLLWDSSLDCFTLKRNSLTSGHLKIFVPAVSALYADIGTLLYKRVTSSINQQYLSSC